MAVILPRGTQPAAQPGEMTAMNLLYTVVLELGPRPRHGRRARSCGLVARGQTPGAFGMGGALVYPASLHAAKEETGPKADSLSPYDGRCWFPKLEESPSRRARHKNTLFSRENRHLPARGSSGLRRYGHPHLPQDRTGLMKPRWPQKSEYPPPKRRKLGKAPETRLFFGKKGQSPGKASLRLLHGGAVWIKQHLHITPAYCGPRSKR